MHTETDERIDGYTALLCAILSQAWRDAQRGNVAALEWLQGPGGANVCEWLDVDRAAILDRLPTS